MMSKASHRSPQSDLRERKEHDAPAAPVPSLPDASGTWVVDTNVILVANGQHEGVSAEDVHTCSVWLKELMQTGRLAVDEGHAIVGEYLHKTHASKGEGVGNEFIRWVLHNLDNPARCDQLTAPDMALALDHVCWRDERLATFDASDRKFVAAALAHPEHPVIWQATDSKWLDWAPVLAEYGVQVRFLCRDAVQAFHQHKFGV